MNLKDIPKLALQHIMYHPERYQTSLPMLFDDTLTQLQKMNRLMSHLQHMDMKLHEVVVYVENVASITKENILIMKQDIEEFKGFISDEMAEFMRLMKEYYMPESVEIVLEEWWSNGKLKEIIDQNVFNDIIQSIERVQYDIDSRGVNIMNYGAKPEEGFDNSFVIYELLQIHDTIFVPEGVFQVSYLDLPPNKTINGIPNKSFFKGFKHDDVGQYVDSIIDVSHIENVVFNGITFDGGITSNTYVSTYDKSKVKNLLRFTECKNIHFNDCVFTRFISNVIDAAVRLTGEFVNWHLATFIECDNIYFNGGRLVSSYLEGISFYKSKQIEIKNFYTKNTFVSTPISTWYSDGFSLIDSDINEDVDRSSGNAGSSLNLCSKNVVVQGCTIKGGTAIDLGNEAEDVSVGKYIQDNVLIVGNVMKCCINAIGINQAFQMNRNIKIVDNFIDATGYVRGINVGNCQHVLIQDNTLFGSDNGIVFGSNNVQDFKVIGNTIYDVQRAVYLVANSGVTMVDFLFDSNTVESKDMSEISGQGGFIVFRSAEQTTGAEVVKNFKIINNIINCSGSWVYVYQNHTNKFIVQGLIVKNNLFRGLNGICERSLSLSYMKDVDIIENIMEDSQQGNLLQFVENPTILNNKVGVSSTVAISRIWRVRNNCTGLLTFEGNRVTKGSGNFHLEGEADMQLAAIETKHNQPDTYSVYTRPSHYGAESYRPSGRYVTQQYFNTTTNKLNIWNGVVWVEST